MTDSEGRRLDGGVDAEASSQMFANEPILD